MGATMGGARLAITEGWSRDEGGCNFCNRHQIDIVTLQQGNHRVYTVARDSGGGIAARFCAECLQDMIEEGAAALHAARHRRP